MERLEKLERVRSLAREVRASGYFDPLMEIRDVMTENGVPLQALKDILHVYEAMDRYSISTEELKKEQAFISCEPAAFDLLVDDLRVPFDVFFKDDGDGFPLAQGIFPFADSDQVLLFQLQSSGDSERECFVQAEYAGVCAWEDREKGYGRVVTPSLDFWKRVRSIRKDLNAHLKALEISTIEGHYFCTKKKGKKREISVFCFDRKPVERRFESGYNYYRVAKAARIRSANVPVMRVLH